MCRKCRSDTLLVIVAIARNNLWAGSWSRNDKRGVGKFCPPLGLSFIIMLSKMFLRLIFSKKTRHPLITFIIVKDSVILTGQKFELGCRKSVGCVGKKSDRGVNRSIGYFCMGRNTSCILWLKSNSCWERRYRQFFLCKRVAFPAGRFGRIEIFERMIEREWRDD